MDEPASGLSRAEAQNLRSLLFHIKERGITILLVEHNMPLVMSTADHVFVLDKGRIAEEGTHAQLLAAGGIYASLWNRQSGGFLGVE